MFDLIVGLVVLGVADFDDTSVRLVCFVINLSFMACIAGIKCIPLVFYSTSSQLHINLFDLLDTLKELKFIILVVEEVSELGCIIFKIYGVA